MSLLPPDSQLVIPKHVLSRELDGETVILDVAGGMYYGLSDVGTSAWQMFADGMSFGDVCQKLTERYDVTLEAVTADIDALVTDLVDKKLVTLA